MHLGPNDPAPVPPPRPEDEKKAEADTAETTAGQQ